MKSPPTSPEESNLVDVPRAGLMYQKEQVSHKVQLWTLPFRKWGCEGKVLTVYIGVPNIWPTGWISPRDPPPPPIWPPVLHLGLSRPTQGTASTEPALKAGLGMHATHSARPSCSRTVPHGHVVWILEQLEGVPCMVQSGWGRIAWILAWLERALC